MAPWFLTDLVLQLADNSFIPQGEAELLDSVLQLLRNFIVVSREGKDRSKIRDFPMKQLKSGATEQLQRAFGYFRSDKWVAVAVSTNPRSERQSRNIPRLTELFQWKPCVAPCLREVQVKPVQ